VLIPWYVYVRKNPWFGVGQIPRDRNWEGATCSRMRSWSRLPQTVQNRSYDRRDPGYYSNWAAPPPPQDNSVLTMCDFSNSVACLHLSLIFSLILSSIPPCFLPSLLFLLSFFFIYVSVIFFHFPYFLSTLVIFLIVLSVIIESTNKPKALFPEVNIRHHFLKSLQTFSQLLMQQIDFGVFSSNV
jgi:hypothetical protein